MKTDPLNQLLNKFKELIGFASLAIAIGFLSAIGAFDGLQLWAEDKRAEFVSNPASEEFVFVGIDTQSIQEFGIWPWPRSIHADVIDKLTEYGANNIGIDIDFSSMSDPEQDISFAMAIGRSSAQIKGNLVLPMFVQDRSANIDDDSLALSAPLQIFAQNSQLATVNVMADSDGVVRRFPNGMDINGTFFPSFPAILSQARTNKHENININFTIDPRTIPSYSVIDLLSDKIAPENIEGKTVIYGAQAVELRDNFTVPVHGTLSGSVVQILAMETMAQGLNVKIMDASLSFLAGCGFLAALFLIIAGKKLSTRIASLLLFACIAELIGFYLFSENAMLLHTAPITVLAYALACLTALFEVGAQHLEALFERAKKQNAERLLNRVVEDSACGIIVIDQNGVELTRNAKALTFFANHNGHLPECLKNDVDFCLSQASEDDFAAECTGELILNRESQNELVLEYVVHKSALDKINSNTSHDAQIKYVCCITVWDVTEKRKQQQKIAYLAKYDELTGAHRRGAFEEAMDTEFDCSIFVFNLHRFKTINLTLGRTVGDELLRRVVERTKSLDPDIRLISRLGGDVFAFSFNKYFVPEAAAKMCEKLIAELEKPFIIHRAHVNIGVQVGFAARLDNTDIRTLLAHAEFALDEARKLQGSSYFLHEIALSERNKLSRRIEKDMWSAMENEEFRLVYQPQIDMRTGEIIGAEALTRWEHSKLGNISPAEFIDLAEANGFIDRLGSWVLEKACQDAFLLPDHMTIAVNISPAQIMRCDVPQMVRDALSKTGLPACRLHIEITEVGILETKDKVILDLFDLREMGCGVALDDFGTGQSSLSYFSNFPINKLKLDQMFIRPLTAGDQNEAIVRSVKALCDGLGLQMICEGVESQEHVDILTDIGVDIAQGYYFGRPMPVSELKNMAQSPVLKTA